MKARLAILIDAENISSRNWTAIDTTARSLGDVNCCRLFGDFSDNRLNNWLELAREHGLEIAMQLSGGKNACDIAMTIAAMDLLHGGKTEGICLVSGDGDFAALALRLRSSGMKVHGLATAKAAPSLQRACTNFTVLGPAKAAA